MAKVNIKPIGDRVLVQHIEEKEQVRGGIIIPDSAKEKPQEAKVIALGTGKRDESGKVAVAGFGHSPVDRRWDGMSMDQTIGAYSILACQKAMDDAGVTADEIDGVICCDSHIAGPSGGSASRWAPRPYFEPPYDSELGLTLVNAEWLIENMGLRNVKFAPSKVPPECMFWRQILR